MSSTVFYVGDVLEVLAKLSEASVDLVLTSPPFLALRSYLPADHPDKVKEGGQERTPGEFVDWLLDVVEACDRVLAPHGSMAFELGDTFSGNIPPFGATPDAYSQRARGTERIDRQGPGWPADKSLTLIPETFRFALAYGINPHTGRKTTPWRIRNVIRWVRPNPPVGALGDKFRPATSEMVVFCRTDEAGRRRYFDLDAVREPYRGNHKMGEPVGGRGKDYADDVRSGWVNRKEVLREDRGGAPPLDWWEIPTHPYKGAHYATWPPELCVKPIKAMSPEKVCVTCGEPSRRVVEQTPEYAAFRSSRVQAQTDHQIAKFDHSDDSGARGQLYQTLGWTDCGHDTWRPGTILDPFAGSGTTLAVANGHGRNAIGIDLDSRNVELARNRVGPMFFEEGIL